MSDAAFVERASEWAKALTQRESRGPGDLENAWRRLEARYGISVRTFWSLRYRRPNEIAASIFYRLHAAYQAECERQMRRLEHDLSIARQIAGPDSDPVREAQALVANARPAKKVLGSVSSK